MSLLHFLPGCCCGCGCDCGCCCCCCAGAHPSCRTVPGLTGCHHLEDKGIDFPIPMRCRWLQAIAAPAPAVAAVPKAAVVAWAVSSPAVAAAHHPHCRNPHSSPQPPSSLKLCFCCPSFSSPTLTTSSLFPPAPPSLFVSWGSGSGGGGGGCGDGVACGLSPSSVSTILSCALRPSSINTNCRPSLVAPCSRF